MKEVKKSGNVKIAIVIASHSAQLARGIVDLTREMAPDVTVIAAGGRDDGSLGTLPSVIGDAIKSAKSAVAAVQGSVLVLTDVGSSTLTVETLLEVSDDSSVFFIDAPLVEGAVVAATRAQAGADRDEIAHAVHELGNAFKRGSLEHKESLAAAAVKIALVVVSHSAKLARGIAQFAAQMAPKVTVVPAGGSDDGTLGTSFPVVEEAIESAKAAVEKSGGSVLVLTDVGLATRTVEKVLEFTGDNSVFLIDGPLVEGTLVAVARAQLGAGRAEITEAIHEASASFKQNPSKYHESKESIAHSGKVRVAVVIAAHSDQIARGVIEITREMAPDVHVVPAGGQADGGIGASKAVIKKAIDSALSSVKAVGGSVLVLSDAGSATVAAQEAVADANSDSVFFIDAPLLEGALVASVRAHVGAGEAEVAQAVQEVAASFARTSRFSQTAKNGKSRVSIVVVSHSAKLARGVAELAREMAPDVTIVAAGGSDDGSLGTSFAVIADGIESAHASADSVLVLTDLGSATTTVDAALKYVGRSSVFFVDAPLVEGTLVGAARAQAGAGQDEVAHAVHEAGVAFAEDTREQFEQVGKAPLHGEDVTVTVKVADPDGIHARTAAKIVNIVKDYAADVYINGVDVKDVMSIMGMQILGGEKVAIKAIGQDAQRAVDAAAVVLSENPTKA